ncbi:MAG: N-acyl amino acid synthase FeeM domain-containing protein [Candidatus Rokuibacteriota bacterium]
MSSTAAPRESLGSHADRHRRHRWTGDGGPGRFRFGLARETGVLDAAFRLVHDQYVWRGFMASPHPSGRRIDLRHALPSTRVFVARDGVRVVGTATLFPDSPLGLPMDVVFADHLDTFRRRERRVAEVSALAMDADRRAHGIPVLMRLLRLVLLHAAEVARLDDLCLVVRSQHANFYQQFFSCRIIGAPRDYEKVRLEAAVALHLDLHEVRALIRAIHAGRILASPVQGFLYGSEAHGAVMAQLHREVPASALTAADFAHFFQGQDVLTEASPAQRAYVGSFHEGGLQISAA